LEFLTEFGLFLAKAVTIVVALMIIVGTVASLGQRTKRHDKGHIEVTKLNESLEEMSDTLLGALSQPAQFKKYQKQKAKDAKQKEKQKQKASSKAKSDDEPESSEPTRVFLLDFKGDIRASEVDSFRETITAVLSQATTNDEIVVRLESAGGMVHSYGLAASQLDRIVKKGIPLTVCVDKVAASGGYMMACVADKVLAAPFAILGSIGVVAQLPNFHRLLKKHDVDYEVLTAGEYKRTLTMFGENSDKGREKFVEDLEETHGLFKSFVQQHRSDVDIDTIATGEVWLGTKALEMKLVDELKTSDEYLVERAAEADVFEVEYVQKKTLQEKVGLAAENSADRLLLRWWNRLRGPGYFS
jgi:serine protease SohB